MAECVMRRFTTILVAAVCLVVSGWAHAAAVAILRPAASSPELTEALFRLQGELLAVGLEVRSAERAAAGGPEQGDLEARLTRLANELGIDAIIDVVGEPKPEAVDVWIVQRGRRNAR